MERGTLVDFDAALDVDGDLDTVIPGVTWDRSAGVLARVQYVAELPFSVLRSLSIPSLDPLTWGPRHRALAVVWPVPFVVLMLVALHNSRAFTTWLYRIPLMSLPFLVGVPVSVALFATTNARHPPRYALALQLMAFVSSIVWLNLVAGEVVSVLELFGLAFGIDSSLLGLTVLAMGNSVGDWVADIAVARAGCPQMGVASCFGSPLLNIVLGLGIASTTYVAKHGAFHVDTHSHNFSKVKLTWLFLAGTLALHLAVFPLCKFKPPRLYGVACIVIYFVYILFSVLQTLNTLPSF